MRKLYLPLALLFAAGLIAAGCGDDDEETETIELVSIEDQEGDFDSDLGEKGESAGDQFGFTDEVERDGEPAGTVTGLCTAIGTEQEPRGLCTFTVQLDEGSVASQAVIDFAREDEPQEFPIVGGSGEFEEAAGTVTLQGGEGKEIPLTLNIIK